MEHPNSKRRLYKVPFLRRNGRFRRGGIQFSPPFDGWDHELRSGRSAAASVMIEKFAVI
jgi:hypothetical protein